MSFLIIFFVPILFSAALALPAGKSWPSFFRAIILSFAGVVLPLFVFFFSGFMVPDWKGACAHGWLDCFIVGKIALAPLVLTATFTLYVLEIARVENTAGRWTVIGIFLGAIVADVCFVFGMAGLGWSAWMCVPFYVAAWYSIRAAQLMKAAGLKFRNYLWALLGSLPFWLLSIWWSKNIYASLPDKAPDGCFIVTAAARGHQKFVGPFFEIEHRGHARFANRQLITFWKFESLWCKKFPRSHGNFRKVYNRTGSRIAKKIHSPWLADLTFVALKPAEWLVSFMLQQR
ncbi:MAG TPA: DUF6688 family protein [Verrucomicrobiae bacterium]